METVLSNLAVNLLRNFVKKLMKNCGGDGDKDEPIYDFENNVPNALHDHWENLAPNY